MARIYSECTYRVCVFHAASDDKIQRNVRDWLVVVVSPCCVICWRGTTAL